METEFVKYIKLPVEVYTGNLDIECARSVVMGWGGKKIENPPSPSVDLKCAYVKVIKQIDCKWGIIHFPEMIMCAIPITGSVCSVLLLSH